jgi:hypothetical protein
MYIAVDFDGTVVSNEYPLVGKDVPHAVSSLGWLSGMGHKLMLWTVRTGFELGDAVRWYEKNGITLSGVNCHPNWKGRGASQRVYADLYVDDRGVGCPLFLPAGWKEPVVDWPRVMELIKARERL